MNKNFNELKISLEQEIAWFEGDEVSVEDAAEHYKKAKDLLTKMEEILNQSELAIKKIK